MNGGRLVAILLAVIVAAGCETEAAVTGDLPANEQAGPVVCAAAIAEGVGLCPQMVALATARLGLIHAPIASTTFRRDICPPNARCMLALPIQGWVIFTFDTGDAVMVHVRPAEDELGNGGLMLVAEEPQALPDWLRDEMAAEA